MPEIVTIDILQVVNLCAVRRNVDADPVEEEIAPEILNSAPRAPHIVINFSGPVYASEYCTKSTGGQWEESYMWAIMKLSPRLPSCWLPYV